MESEAPSYASYSYAESFATAPSGRGNPAAQALLDYLQSAKAADVIKAYGYNPE